MRRVQSRSVALLLGALLAALVYASCRSTPAHPRDEAPRPSVTPAPAPAASPVSAPPVVVIEPAPESAPAAPLAPPEPTLRIGVLVGAARASVGADSGVLVWSGSQGRTEGLATRVQRATFVPASSDVPAARFRVQVASVSDAAAAERLARLAEKVVGQTALVRWSDDTRTYQVRVGAYATREEAQAAAARLRLQGLSGAWTPASLDGALARLRLIETGQEFETVTVAPARAEEGLSVDASPYRGLFELRAGTSGGVTVVNLVNLEDYLRGVVPNELSPVSFGEIEAQKAQAVAARTYALRNRGQFAAQGFDLCATPSCQVYKGRSSEHPLSDQAVADTAGIVALWRGRPINAYYTSTCGGHTEDDANVFDTDEPYLKGVVCQPEQAAWSVLHTTAEPLLLVRPGLGRDVALLVALGVVEPRYQAAAALDGPAREGELRRWLAALAASAGRTACEAPAGALTRRGGFWRHAVGVLCWGERAQRLLAPGDPDYLLRVADRAQLSEAEERRAAALLIAEGLLVPFDDDTLRPAAPVARADALELLAGLARKLGPPSLVSAEFRGATPEGLEVLAGTPATPDATERLPLAPDARLFRDFDGRVGGARELSLAVGDGLQYVAREGRIVWLQAEQSPRGPSADRGSRYFRWEVRATPAEIQRSAGTSFPVADVQPRRFGVSGRVAELALVGAERQEQVVRGLRIRSALGLRENLFVVERERDAQGGVRRFIFTGKGWGHGVGLCQVGAFGLARSGATFEQILKHYYSGVTVGPLP